MKKACFVTLLAMFVFVFAMPMYASVHVTSRAAIVMDFETGDILFERDIHTARVPASTTKAMTAFVVYEEIAAGNLTMDTLIRISANASRIASDSNMQGAPFALAAGSYHTVDTLLQLAMLPSSNGANVALAEHISGTEAEFAVKMNEIAYSIGMFSEFTNSHGALPHYTNAYSLALLTRTFIQRHPDILRITGAATMQFQGRTVSNTNLLLHSAWSYAGADGFRTGTTREAGFCLISTAYRDGRRLIVVVMGAADNNGRYGDTHRLLDFGFAEAARRDAERPLTISLNGENMELDIAPQMADGNAMVPLRPFFEALDWAVNWNAETSTAILTNAEGYDARIAAGNRTIYINHLPHTLDAPAQIINERMFVSVQFLALALSQQSVNWDASARTIMIDGAYMLSRVAEEVYTAAVAEYTEYNNNEYADDDDKYDDSYDDEYPIDNSAE